MKGNRWFLLAFAFLLLNGYAVFRWLDGAGHSRSVHPALVAPENGPQTNEFRSGSLELLDIRQSNLPSDGSVQLDFEFNQKVLPEALMKCLTAKTADGKPVACHVAGGQAPGKTIRISLGLLVVDQVSVRVLAGLQGTAGPLGLEKDVEREVKISRVIRVLHLTARAKPFERGQVEVVFNAPVNPQEIGPFIKVQPEIETAVESSYSYYGRQRVRILGDFKAGENYTITFAKGLTGEQGGRMDADEVRTVYFPACGPGVDFSARGTYLSTKGNLSIPLKLVNSGDCKVSIRRVYSNNLVQLAARQAGRAGYYYEQASRGLDQRIGEFELPVQSAANEVVERNLDLRQWLEGMTGAFHIEVHGKKGGASSQYVVVSDLGLSVRQSGKDMLVWVNSINTLDAVEGATVKIHSLENQLLLSGETDAQGLVRFDPAQKLSEGEPFLVTVEKGDDLTFMRLDNTRLDLRGATGNRPYLDTGYEAFVFTDRGIYRPGETVNLKAVVRGRDAACPDAFPVELNVIRPDGKTDRTLNAMLNNNGTAEFGIPLADYIATGKYRLQLKLPGAKNAIGETVVSVEEFVPPQIRASIGIPPERIAAGQAFGFKVSAQHLFGRPAAGMPVGGRVDFIPCAFASTHWPDYSFGDYRRKFETVQQALGKKTLDANGEMEFGAETSAKWRPPASIRAVVSGTVTETGGRAVTEYASRMVDVYPFYIGIRRPSDSIEVGAARSFVLATVHPDGSPSADSERLNVSIEKLNWATVLRQEGDHYAYRSEMQAVPVEQYAVEMQDGKAVAGFTPAYSGRYRLNVEDPQSGASSSLDFWVCSPGQSWVERSMEAPDVVELKLDKDGYRAGDTARFAIQSPFPGKALLTVESDRILLHRVLELTNNTAEVELPIEAAFSPNVYCSVSVVRPAQPEEVWGQHRAAGRIALRVDEPERKLDIAMELPVEMRPGTRLEIPVRVADSAGHGVRAEIVLAAVDEGICMLSGFKTPDPYAYFFGPRLPGMTQHDLYAQLMPETLAQLAGTASAPGGGMMAEIGKRLNPIKARRFKPVALWSASVETDTNGQARVVFEVPEFSGQLRIMAVAVDRSRFGSAEQSVLVKRPLVVQSSLPRFLAPDDVFILPVRVYNEAKQEDEVLVSVSCGGPLECETASARVALPAGSATNLEFQLKASAMPGKAVCKLTAEMGPERYVEEVEIAVRPASPRIVHTGSGKVAAGQEARIAIPAKWLPGTGEADLWLSAMPSVNLGGSLDYLIDYPYGCLEQTTSKSFPLLYLAELAEQTRPGWLGKDGTTYFVNAGIYRILSMQQNGGCFSLWSNGETYYWGSIYATHFLVEASRAGYAIPKDQLDDALGYLERQVRNASLDDDLYTPSYACHVLALAGRPQHGTVARLCELWNKLDRDARINVVSSLLSADKRRQAIELLDTMGQTPVSPIARETGGSLRSEVRSDSFLLSALLDVDPQSDWIPPLVRRLEAARSNGRWMNTQDNAVALMALGKYVKRLASEQKPISGTLVWNSGAKSSDFANRDEFHAALEELDGESVTVRNTGEGDLFLYWKSAGVPLGGEVDESDHGIAVRRQLLDMDGSPVDPNALRQGELYIMQVTLSSTDRLENIVVEDLLPAGLEVENAALKTAQSVEWIKKKQTLSLQHLDIRDDRVIAFPCAFSGKQTYYYAVRAVTAGGFVWPAISASCMYDPEIQSVHGRSDIVLECGGN